MARICWLFLIFFFVLVSGCEDSEETTVSILGPLSVSSVNPAADATSVFVHQNMIITFDRAMNAADITAQTSNIITLKNASGDPVPVVITSSTDKTTFTLNPSNDLSYNTLYTIEVNAAAKDLSGDRLGQTTSSSFRTISYNPVYTSTNLADHTVSEECNPGGTTACPCSASDVALSSAADYGTVTSNVLETNTWVNAIGGRSFSEQFPTGDSIILGTYRYQYKVKLPALPATDVNQIENSGAVHMVMFFWDGRNALWQADKRSIEAGLYWELNAWNEDFGAIKVYDTNILTLTKTGITLTPDTEWHSFELIADFANRKYISVKIDGQTADLSSISTILVERPTWGNELSFLITEESLSTYPGADCAYVFRWGTFFKDLEFGYLGSI